ncbi:polysaccharide lyase 6 family protein [Pedobacter sp. ISL-68]|uniref:polysaccharide lyase 6 family protein n=1 Tax=unclassified Pedobacter TaxID=2628915 RepID=UPI001BE7E730|nr:MULTISPECIES: polysaccharide lyase 6 family protein [unclassified Pedobacter]MBT2560681.1 polysaccharide lyase 6 family protein [Pedobacter sp. ISL-64]MBT2590060.1 polysaccharide lyase 6 family protein [Pedobacter sp. ISL-68]
MKFNFCLTAILIGCSIYGSAKDYKISTAAELAALKLLPGDKVIVKNGEWTNQQMIFRGNGTQQNPIRLIAEQGGQVFFTGASSLKIDGTWLIADGISFKNGFTKGEDVIVFSEESANCRLTNSSVVGYNPPDKAKEYTFGSLYGNRNRVDHCYFEGKTNQGPTLVVWLSDKPNYHQIDHNYFGSRPDIGGNGGETIRIGTSTWSFHDSFTKVDANIFAHCDGETEIVSVKSCKNTISNNLFFESVGTLTLRHGNNNEVFGNIFIGNKIANTGGIRVIGENHKVHHNYLQGLTGTGLRAAISVMDGLPNPILVSHWQVKNAEITANTIVDCTEAFSIGAGKNADRILAPQKVVITDNLVKADTNPVSWADKAADVTFSGNMLDAKSAPQDLGKGFSLIDAKFEKQQGIWSLKGQKTGANLNSDQLSILKTKNIGPNWFKPVQAMVVK